MVKRLLLLALCLTNLNGSCETAPTTGYEDVNKEIAEALQKVGLGPGDVFEVAVYGEPSMSGLYRVSDDGTIQFPLINRVGVEGFTPGEIADEIQKRLQDGYLRSPIVNVFVKEYNSKKVFVLGEVQKPGTFPYAARMNIVEAITLAGGFQDSANENYVIVTRQDKDGKDQRFPIAVEKITQGEAPNFNLQPGDIIFVPDTLL